MSEHPAVPRLPRTIRRAPASCSRRASTTLPNSSRFHKPPIADSEREREMLNS